jgi:hypothetical protein
MNRWIGMKSDPMQYQGLAATSALDAHLPASEVPGRAVAAPSKAARPRRQRRARVGAGMGPRRGSQ